jgi:hypothetical protein
VRVVDAHPPLRGPRAERPKRFLELALGLRKRARQFRASLACGGDGVGGFSSLVSSWISSARRRPIVRLSSWGALEVKRVHSWAVGLSDDRGPRDLDRDGCFGIAAGDVVARGAEEFVPTQVVKRSRRLR